MAQADDRAALAIDASVLSCFARAGRLDLLRRIVNRHRCVVVEAVFDEIERGAREHPSLAVIGEAAWLERVRADTFEVLVSFSAYHAVLGAGPRNVGEASTLAWAEAHGATALVDDHPAVIAARKRGVTVRRTLYLVCEAVRTTVLTRDDAARLVDELVHLGGARFPCDGITFIPWAEEQNLL